MDRIAYEKGVTIVGSRETMLIEGEPATADKIIDNLWMGSAPPMMHAVSQYFNALALCACEYQPHEDCFFNVHVHHAPLHDNPSFIPQSEIVTAVRAAGKVIHWINEGKTILVTCLAGLNRSGLVTAIALCAGPWKMSVHDAIESVRAARGPWALSNPQFVAFLEKYCNRPKQESIELVGAAE
jgi:hypothetical protein